MKTVLNKTRKPIKVSLPRGKVLHLGPGKTGQISDDAADRDGVKKLIKAGEIEIVGQGEQVDGSPVDGGPVHSSTHGHASPSVIQKRGDR